MHWSHPLINLSQNWLFQISAFIAQATPSPTPTPKTSPSPAADVELLKSQIQFLQDANTQLNNSFGSFVSAINLSFVVLGVLFGVIAAISIYFFNQSLKDAKLLIREEVERRLKSVVDETVGQEVSNLKQVLDREKIVGEITIDYFIPSPQAILPDDYPEEYEFLAARGFKETRLLSASKRVKFSGDVVILDLVNYALIDDSEKINKSEAENAQLLEIRVAETLNKIVNRVNSKSILVVYIRPGKQRINAIDELSKSVKYYASANTPVSLMGVVVDSAYVAHGMK
ncbi:MAG: hypothetical protein KME23_16470 [Goleter apudmare HA4340-LM2]|jgi:hypothetical protein|nr:hypothetical protein [Goleter apudmare HA4340-LM2]